MEIITRLSKVSESAQSLTDEDVIEQIKVVMAHRKADSRDCFTFAVVYTHINEILDRTIDGRAPSDDQGRSLFLRTAGGAEGHHQAIVLAHFHEILLLLRNFPKELGPAFDPIVEKTISMMLEAIVGRLIAIRKATRAKETAGGEVAAGTVPTEG